MRFSMKAVQNQELEAAAHGMPRRTLRRSKSRLAACAIMSSLAALRVLDARHDTFARECEATGKKYTKLLRVRKRL